MDNRIRREESGELISDDVKRRLKKWERRRNAMIVLTCLLIGAVIVAAVGLFAIKKLFTVNQILCPDTPYYSSEEILEAAGASTGKGIFFIDEEALCTGALQALPLLMDLQVEKEYPDKLILTPIVEEPLFYFVADVPDNEYVVVAKSMKVIHMIDEEGEMNARYPDLLQVQMPALLYTVEGKHLGFAGEGDERYIPDFLELVRDSAFGDEVVYVDLKNRFEITLHCASEQGTSYRVFFGNKKNAKEKMEFAEGIKNRIPENFSGLIGVEDPKKGYADPD